MIKAAGADTRPADHHTSGLIMTKKEKELENKGYMYWRTCDTPQQAKERAAIMRRHGFRATVHTVIGDSELFTTWEVIARTAKTITIKNGDEIRKRRINKWYAEHYNIEAVLPYGEYSMCPVLRATSDN